VKLSLHANVERRIALDRELPSACAVGGASSAASSSVAISAARGRRAAS
jgi:hypothetical protein